VNVDDYIKSGVLQDYCLGFLSDEEARNVEALCKIHPEIAGELELLRMALEQYAGSHKMWQRPELKKAIWEAIKKIN
jgi:hypothetical protein